MNTLFPTLKGIISFKMELLTQRIMNQNIDLGTLDNIQHPTQIPQFKDTEINDTIESFLKLKLLMNSYDKSNESTILQFYNS